jgi:hypothetical protein
MLQSHMHACMHALPDFTKLLKMSHLAYVPTNVLCRKSEESIGGRATTHSVRVCLQREF